MSVRLAKHAITTSRDGKQLYGFLTQAPLSAVIARNPHLLTLIAEIVTQLDLERPHEYIEQDLGRVIGYSEVVETTDKDTVFYARKSQHSVYTRFVKGRKVESTTWLTLSMQQDPDGDYELRMVNLGEGYPPFPGDTKEATNSHSYWQDHAIVYNGQALASNTITKDCPY